MKRRILLILGCSFLIFGCGIPDRNIPYVSYIEIEKMRLITNQNEGASTSNFRDAWLFLDGSTNGVYELPRKIPIISEDRSGAFDISIQAGIRENGINSQTRVYPFVGNYTSTIILEENETATIEPFFEYLANVQFRLNADFETVNLFDFDEDGNEGNQLVISSENAASGNKSGRMLPGSNNFMEQASTQVYRQIPSDGSPVFIEIDYFGDLDLNVGVIGIEAGQSFKEYFVSLRSEELWKKAYINITDLIVSSKLDGYQIVLGVDNPNGAGDERVFVDNIKLLHF